jgi:YesN/AraC family two-component response regulator
MSNKKLQVVIADDDRSMREALTQVLHNLGHEVVASADNGRSLLERCSETDPDVVITDNLMPHLRGVDAAAQIYARYRTPVILLSGYCDRNFVLEAERSHVLVYLVKPISETTLKTALARCRAKQRLRGDENDDIEITTLGQWAGGKIRKAPH